MEIQKIAVYHPNGRDKMIINQEDYDRNPKAYKLWDQAVAPATPPAPPAPQTPAGAPPVEVKGKVLAFDSNLATEEGILALTDESVYDNKKAKALADILGMEYGQKESGDLIRKRLFEAVAKLFKP